MSTHESERNSSQDKPQSSKPGNSIPPKAQHSPDKRKPLPFDDDDNGTSGQMVDTSNPKMGDNEVTTRVA